MDSDYTVRGLCLFRRSLRRRLPSTGGPFGRVPAAAKGQDVQYGTEGDGTMKKEDEEHLKLLAIFHYVVGGIVGMFALFPIFHLILGLVLILAPGTFQGQGGPPPPAVVGWIMVVFPAMFIAIGGALAGCVIAAGRCLARRRRYLFCVVMAAIECIFMPLGTVLGVFTIIVLMRDSVKEAFAAGNTMESDAPVGERR